MKPFVIAAGLLTCFTSDAFTKDRVDSGLAYCQDYCLAADGKLEKSIDRLSSSDTFPNERSMGSSFTYISYTTPC